MRTADAARNPECQALSHARARCSVVAAQSWASDPQGASLLQARAVCVCLRHAPRALSPKALPSLSSHSSPGSRLRCSAALT